MKISWLKLDVGILDNKKIKLVRNYPDGDSLFVLWVGLLCLAMRSSVPGQIFVAERVPYSAQDLATIFELDQKTVEMGIGIFQRYGMITIHEGGIIDILNFTQDQSLDKINCEREQSRMRVARHREARRAIEHDVTHNTVTCNGIDKRREDKSREEKTSKGKGKGHVFDPSFSSISKPDNLNTDRFAATWTAWVKHRREKRAALTETTVSKQIAELSAAGEASAVAMLENAITRGWTGFFPLKGAQGKARVEPALPSNAQDKFDALRNKHKG